jgi:hypothetical protein
VVVMAVSSPVGLGLDVLVPFVEGGGSVVLVGGDEALPAGAVPGTGIVELCSGVVEVVVEVVELAGDAAGWGVLVAAGASEQVFPVAA